MTDKEWQDEEDMFILRDIFCSEFPYCLMGMPVHYLLDGGSFVSGYLINIFNDKNGVTWHLLQNPPGVGDTEPSYTIAREEGISSVSLGSSEAKLELRDYINEVKAHGFIGYDDLFKEEEGNG
jgi:hypothetical protein